MEEKRCTKCSITKNLTEFYFNKSYNAYYSACKPCHNSLVAKSESRRTKVKQEAKQLIVQICSRCNSEWRPSQHCQENRLLNSYCPKCRRILGAKKWTLANPEKARESARKTGKKRPPRPNTPERNARLAIWREANRDQLREYHREWQKNHPEKKRKQTSDRRARLRGAAGEWTIEEWRQLKARYGNACLRCGKKEPNIVLSFDHVVPISRGGSNTIENAQPLCVSCNAWKHARIIDFRTRAA